MSYQILCRSFDIFFFDINNWRTQKETRKFFPAHIHVCIAVRKVRSHTGCISLVSKLQKPVHRLLFLFGAINGDALNVRRNHRYSKEIIKELQLGSQVFGATYSGNMGKICGRVYGRNMAYRQRENVWTWFVTVVGNICYGSWCGKAQTYGDELASKYTLWY